MPDPVREDQDRHGPSKVGEVVPVIAAARRGVEKIVRWWLGAGVQVRSTVAATLLQAAVVAAAGAVLLLALHNNLQTSIDAGNLATAQGISAFVDQEIAGSSAASGDNVTEQDNAPDRDDLQGAIDAAARRRAVVQVLNADGAVIASSSDLRGFRSLAHDVPAAGETRILERGLPFDDDPYRFTALGGDVDGARFTVLIGQSLGTGEDTLHAAEVALAVAGPLLLLAVAGATYLFIGRSLRPVAGIRSTVEGISLRDLSERVPVPPGNDEVSQLARTMNTMLADLDRATTAQRQFVSDASHELRSPVATLRAAADIALTVPDRGDRADLAVLVRGEAERLDRLVADLLLLARVDEHSRSSTHAPRLDEVDLDDLVTTEARRLRTATTLDVAARREPARVLGDTHALSRVLRNLTDNAARHAATTVSITLHRNGSTAVLDVVNDGPPIPGADRERVFDRFVRLEESRARDLGGTGLGLAIVREIVLAHGGTVRVLDPDSGPGTCFRIELPISEFAQSPEDPELTD